MPPPSINGRDWYEIHNSFSDYSMINYDCCILFLFFMCTAYLCSYGFFVSDCFLHSFFPQESSNMQSNFPFKINKVVWILNLKLLCVLNSPSIRPLSLPQVLDRTQFQQSLLYQTVISLEQNTLCNVTLQRILFNASAYGNQSQQTCKQDWPWAVSMVAMLTVWGRLEIS